MAYFTPFYFQSIFAWRKQKNKHTQTRAHTAQAGIFRSESSHLYVSIRSESGIYTIDVRYKLIWMWNKILHKLNDNLSKIRSKHLNI